MAEKVAIFKLAKMALFNLPLTAESILSCFLGLGDGEALLTGSGRYQGHSG
jgi:hypothetical protein